MLRELSLPPDAIARLVSLEQMLKKQEHQAHQPPASSGHGQTVQLNEVEAQSNVRKRSAK